MYIYSGLNKNTQKSIQEIRIIARIIVLDLNHNALLISSISLLRDKLVYSGSKTWMRYKNKQPFWKYLADSNQPRTRAPVFPLTETQPGKL